MVNYELEYGTLNDLRKIEWEQIGFGLDAKGDKSARFIGMLIGSYNEFVENENLNQIRLGLEVDVCNKTEDWGNRWFNPNCIKRIRLIYKNRKEDGYYVFSSKKIDHTAKGLPIPIEANVII